jgi:hypothetical protein
MVHDLQTLARLNAPKPGAKAAATPKPFVPDKIALNPAAAREFLNRPWTKEELGGKESVYETYARGEREPFRNREPATEGARA